MQSKLEDYVQKSIYGKSLFYSDLDNKPEMTLYQNEIICLTDDKCFKDEDEINEMNKLMRQHANALEF